jgi:hypothetical protein
MATVTVWNKGDISILVLMQQGSKDPFALLDRVLKPEEDVSLLLENQIQEILNMQNRSKTE